MAKQVIGTDNNGTSIPNFKKYMLERIDWHKGGGLVPAIVQHSLTGRVLMLGYMNRASLSQTLDTRLVTFYSRSRNQLWCKGESSGNTLALIDIAVDCDKDTLLLQALPAGPTCHLNLTSCFDAESADSQGRTFADGRSRNGFGILGQLESTINSRKGKPVEESYTSALFDKGIAKMAQKVGEEGVEVALAAVQENRQELLEESADLLYHLLVVLADQGLGLQDVASVLDQRSQ